MKTNRFDRRTLVLSASTIAAGVFAVPRFATAAQTGTPAAAATPIPTPLAYASTRLRTVVSADARDKVTAAVKSNFVDQVKSLNGYEGYLLANVSDQPTQQVALTVLQNESQADAFDQAAAGFVSSVADLVDANATQTWAGDVFIATGTASPAGTPVAATPAATPVAPAATPIAGTGEWHVAVRVHTSKSDTDPRNIVGQVVSGFLPIVTGLPGFQGYLWYPIDGGFVAISLFDSVASADASNTSAQQWESQFIGDYTDGNPTVINGTVVYVDLPVIRGGAA